MTSRRAASTHARYSTTPSASNSKDTIAPRYSERLTATTSYGTTTARSSEKHSKHGTPTSHFLTGGESKMTLMAGEQADTTKHGQVWCVPARLPSRECERTAKGITKASDRVTVPEAVYWVHLPVSLAKISSIKRGTCLWTQTNDYRSF